MTPPTVPDPGLGHRPDPSEVFTERQGVVAMFDEAAGSGVVVGDPTGAAWYFHCTRIAGGRRTIEVATPVRFRTEPGPTGMEAVDVTPVDG